MITIPDTLSYAWELDKKTFFFKIYVLIGCFFSIRFSHHLIYVGCISNSFDSAQPLKQPRRNYDDSFDMLH